MSTKKGFERYETFLRTLSRLPNRLWGASTKWTIRACPKALPLQVRRDGLDGEAFSFGETPKSRTTLYQDRHDNQNAADGGIISFRSLSRSVLTRYAFTYFHGDARTHAPAQKKNTSKTYTECRLCCRLRRRSIARPKEEFLSGRIQSDTSVSMEPQNWEKWWS